MHAHDDNATPSASSVDMAEMLDAAPVLIWVSAADKGGVYFNRTWREFTGRTLEEEAGDGWISAVHPDDMPALEVCAEAFARREPFTTEFRLRRHDGAWRWMIDMAVPRFSPRGEFAGYIGCCVDITERKGVEAALRSSEERLQLAQEAAAVGTYDWNIRDNRITWSPEMFRLHGIDPDTPQDKIYAAWLERLHPDDRDRADGETRDFVERADNLAIEFRIVHPEAGVRWVQGRGRMIRDSEGAPIRMIGVNFDITERRAAEEALRDSEQRLRDIAENFPGVIFRRITYPDGRIEYPYFSGADEHVFGISRDQLMTISTMEDVAQLIHYEDLGEMLAKFEHAAATLTPLEMEGRVIPEEGKLIWVRSISRPRPREDGALIWDGVILNVTEQHRQQGERERAATMLRMSMEVAGIGTWEFDPAERHITGSGITNAIFGLPDDGAPRPIDDYMCSVHPEDVGWVRRGLIESAEQKQHTAREYRVMSADGTVRWLASRGSYVRLADGSERLIGALYDVTEHWQREAEREAALRHQQTLLRELNHRVKNNLQMVTSVLQLQAGRVSEPVGRAQFEEGIRRVQTIADLHAQFSIDGSFGQVEFSEFLQQLCDKLRGSMLGHGKIDLRCEAGRSVIDLDRAVPLGLIVNELVTNSIKHAFADAASGVIAVALERGPEDSMVLSVSDNGRGLPEEDGGGDGLGMRLVRGLCAQLGGDMEITRQPGTTYVITVPASREGG